MPVDRRTGRDEAAPAYSTPAADDKSLCAFEGPTKCGLRGTVGYGSRYYCSWHDERMRTTPGRVVYATNGTFTEFYEWMQGQIADGDIRWQKHDANWWWMKITGEEMP